MAERLRARLPDRPSRTAALHPGCDAAASGQYPSATAPGAACRRQEHDEADATRGAEFDTGAPDRTRDDLAYVAVRPQPIEGGAGAQEHPAAGRFRSPVLQIGCDRLSHVMRQGQRPFHAAFAMHAQTAFAPVDIAQFEPDDLPCTQPEPRKQQQDGSIAQPRRRSPLSCSRPEEPEHSRPASLSESTPSTIRRRRALPRQDRYGCSRGTVRSGRTTAVP